MRNKANELLTDPDKVKERLKEYCSDLYNHKPEVNHNTLDKLESNSNAEREQPISLFEVENAIKRLKNG